MNVLILWLLCGTLFGALITLIIVAICINIEESRDDKKEFVKKLIEKEGWDGANTILTFEFCGKYLNIWRKLYKEHIKGENNNE